MPVALPAETREIVKSLWIQGVTNERILQQTGVKPGTLKTWTKRYNWPLLRSKVKQDVDRACVVVVQDGLANASEALRGKMSALLEKHTESLAKVSAKPSLKHIQQVGAALEPLVRSAKAVYDWGQQDSIGIVQVSAVRDALEVEAQVTSEPVVASSVVSSEPAQTQVGDKQ